MTNQHYGLDLHGSYHYALLLLAAVPDVAVPDVAVPDVAVPDVPVAAGN